MALPKDYPGQRCSLSRALEVIGERWTLLIMRDAFFGVRRFGDFAAHLGVPRDLLSWGDEYYSANGPRRVFQHAQDAGPIGPDGACATCGGAVPLSDLVLL